MYVYDSSLSGFNDPLAFKDLNDKDIEKIEKYMRERALEFVASIHESVDTTCNVLLDNEQLTDIFGERYSTCPEQFQFLPGQINLIKILVSHVKKLVDGDGENMGLSQFNAKKKRAPKKTTNLLQALNRIDDHRHTDRTTAINEASHDLLVDQLYEKLLTCLISHGVDTTNMNKNSVEVDESGAHGDIHCALCPNSEIQRVFYHSANSSRKRSYWVMSNYNRHLEKIHKLKINRLEKITQKCVKRPALTETNVKMQPIRDGMSTVAVVEDSLIESHSEHIEPNSVEDSILPSEPSLGNNDDSLQFIGFISRNQSTCTNDNVKLWLYTQISEQIQQMVAASLINSESERHMKFNLKNQDRSITVVETSRDGNCLFSALAHQLWPNQITTSVHKQNTKKLRKNVVEHILKEDKFHLYENILRDRIERDQKFESATSVTTECKLFVRHGLSRQGNWGGLETIKAVSNEYCVNVVVVNECGPCNMITGSNDYKHSLVIAYRLGTNTDGCTAYNHYDSVSDMNSEDIYAAADFIINK